MMASYLIIFGQFELLKFILPVEAATENNIPREIIFKTTFLGVLIQRSNPCLTVWPVILTNIALHNVRLEHTHIALVKL